MPSVAAIPTGGDVSTMHARPRARRSLLGWRSLIPHRSTRLRFCGWPRRPVRIRTSLAPSSSRIALQDHGAAEGVGIPHPLGEDVDAAAADGRGGALERVMRAVNLAQQVHALPRPPATEQRTRSAGG